ncbi:uncharacterized protein LOC121833464 [Ixodes scapularis]|uniref:uncharacterized protein LOC121833464 n=1 Tax=Ixodes scapularis TaxID=6945 RepID=UPI001C380951|nr:uncharacterized protein LOC121833464 [Ixodes scapularis]
MARLACVFLVFVLAYQCADVVNGAVEVVNLPSFVGNKGEFLQTLKELCYQRHNTRVISALDLSQCYVSCYIRHARKNGGRTFILLLTNREPCSNVGGICIRGECVYES